MSVWPSLTVIVPLLGALVAAALGYVSGRLLETRKQLILQKGQAYADYGSRAGHKI
jgi:membrane protein DedA with SNARE-associated domain